MRITESQLRRIVKKLVNEQAQKGGPVNLLLDVDSEYFGGGPLAVGTDVTLAFDDDIGKPTKAVVVNPSGPGGGNPEILFSFPSEDAARDWYMITHTEGYGDVRDFKLALRRAAKRM